MNRPSWIGALALVAVAFLGGPLSGTAAAADEYRIDPVHSSIAFSVKHMVISRVKGHFNEFEGVIHYDEKHPENSSVSVTIKAASIDTNNKKRDADVAGEQFLEAEKYPEITFKSSAIERKGDGFVAVGTLTIHGVSKKIRLPFSLGGVITDPWGNTRMGLESSIEINRQDFGLSFNRKLESGGLLVGDTVKIDLAIEAVKVKPEGASG